MALSVQLAQTFMSLNKSVNLINCTTTEVPYLRTGVAKMQIKNKG